VSETKPLYLRKYRRCRRCAPPRRHVDCRLHRGVFFIFVRCATWRIEGLLTQQLYQNGCVDDDRYKKVRLSFV